MGTVYYKQDGPRRVNLNPPPPGPHVAVTELVPGTIVRIIDGIYKHPFCLDVEHAKCVSKETGAISITGKVLPASGLPGTRKKPLRRSVLVLPHRADIVYRGKPRTFTAKLGPVKPGTLHWVIIDDAKQESLLSAGGIVPWHSREFAEMTQEEQLLLGGPIEQMQHRVRQERGILKVDRLTYDLSVWHHDSAMELVDGQWKCTNVCKRCGRKLAFMKSSPWWQTLDSDTTCHGEVWVP